MTSETRKPQSRHRKAWWIGVGSGVALMAIVVLASGFMIETTNTDRFCVTCHAMQPFRTAWQSSVHGGRNPRGVTAQCVDCHLPHGNFVEYLVTKAITGTGDVLQNMVFDPAAFDWAGNAEKRRLHFTFDSACRRCHHELTPPGLTAGGFIAHRAYLRGDVQKRCTECHPHVGHDDMVAVAEAYFRQP